MPTVGQQAGYSGATVQTFGTMANKLRARDNFSFRPETSDQEKLIADAQAATGLKMSELLRRAVLLGLPTVVAEIKKQQAQAFEMFETHVRTLQGQADPHEQVSSRPHEQVSSRKNGKTVTG